MSCKWQHVATIMLTNHSHSSYLVHVELAHYKNMNNFRQDRGMATEVWPQDLYHSTALIDTPAILELAHHKNFRLEWRYGQGTCIILQHLLQRAKTLGPLNLKGHGGSTIPETSAQVYDTWRIYMYVYTCTCIYANST